MARVVERCVIAKTTEANIAKSSTAVKCEGEKIRTPPDTNVVSIYCSDHVQQAGHDDELSPVIGRRNLYSTVSEIERTPSDIKQTRSKVPGEAEHVQNIARIRRVQLALHHEPEHKHAGDGNEEQSGAAPALLQGVSRPRHQPACDQWEINEAGTRPRFSLSWNLNL